jgi:hypothetical protein
MYRLLAHNFGRVNSNNPESYVVYSGFAGDVILEILVRTQDASITMINPNDKNT